VDQATGRRQCIFMDWVKVCREVRVRLPVFEWWAVLDSNQ